MASPPNPTAAFLWISPLPNWTGTAQRIATDIFIRQLTDAEKAALARSEPLLQHHEIASSAIEGCWLCHEFENPHEIENVRFRRRQEAAFKLMLHAMYAIQILAPIGAPNLFLLYRQTDQGPALDSTQHRQASIGTQWAAQCECPASFEEQVRVVFDRVHQAFRKPKLRLQIPVWLLEQGLSAPDRHIRILLWATGLDGITRSGGIAAFGERLGSLLGAERLVFPPDRSGRTPKYTVGDVAADLYLLRTEMAHGLPFHEKFRRTVGFLAQDGRPISEDSAGFRYDHVLEECAGFLLCRALAEVFLRDLTFDVQSMSWSSQAVDDH